MKAEKEQVLENFMKEFFPFKEFKEIGFFTKDMRGDYQAQADKVCKFFGYKSVFEYGVKEVSCHISYGSGLPNDKAGLDSAVPMYVDDKGELKDEPFITVVPSIY